MSTVIAKEKLGALGIFIKNKRLSKQIGLLEFAKKLEISGAYLSTLESGKHPKINPLLLKKIAYLLEIDYLILYKMIGYSHITMNEIESGFIPDNENLSEIIRLGNTLNPQNLEMVIKFMQGLEDVGRK